MTQERASAGSDLGRTLQPGRRIERYVVDAMIGAGGTATVYRVKHAELGHVYALKVLSIVSPAIRRRTLQEGKLQAQMNHRNIVAVYDVFDVDGAPGLLMEYVQGMSLETAMTRYAFTLPQAEILFRGILEGVRQAHSLGLVHRDLKPANVLLAETSRGVLPKVTDFGIAKVVEDGDSGHTRAGVAMGTPQYMAPEQIRDARTVDQRADIFSLGCLLYELVTHKRAFPQEDILKVYNAVCDGQYIPARELVPDLPDRITRAIDGALLVDRAQRIPDCDTLREVFEGRRAWPPDATDAADQAEGATHAIAETVAGVAGAAAYLAGGEAPLQSLPAAVRDDDTENEPTQHGSRWDAGEDDPDAAAVSGVLASDGGLPAAPVSGPPTTLSTHTPAPAEGTVAGATGSSGATGRPFATALISAAVLAASLALAWQAIAPPPPGAPDVTAPIAPTDVAPAAAEALPPPATEVPPAAPTEAPAAPPAPPPAATPTVAPATPTEPAAAAPKKPEPRKDPAPGTVAATVEQVKPAAPTEPATAPETVRLLSVPPTATLWVDGQEVGRTPAKVTLAPGRHQIRLKSGDQVASFLATVKAGEENRWCFVFADQKAVAGPCPK